MIAMPCPAKFQMALAAVAPMTASSGPGIWGRIVRAQGRWRSTATVTKQRGQMDVGQAAADLVELDECLAGIGFDAQHLAEDRDADLKADSGEKSDEYGPGKEVGDEAEFEQAREQEKACGEQCNHACERHVARAGGRRHAGIPL